MKTDRIWYVVLGTNRARILRGLPAAEEPTPIEITLQAGRRNLRETLAGPAPDRHAPAAPHTDPIREDAIGFLREIFRYLEEELEGRAFDGLVLVAAPDVLDLWQAEVPASLKGAVRRQINRNLVRLPTADLAPAIGTLMAD